MMTQPKFRGSSHHFMFFVSIIASTFLILKSTNSTELVATIVYSIGLLSMFGFSALYHRKKTTLEIKQRLRKLDHTGIFLMIAGTFTPICLLSLPLESGLKLLTIIWSVAAVGILQSIFFSRIHRLLRASIYLIAGWVASLPMCWRYSTTTEPGACSTATLRFASSAVIIVAVLVRVYPS